MPKLNFKFSETSGEGEQHRVIDRLREVGARDIHPLFPNDPEPELSNIYSADVPDDCRETRLLDVLKKEKQVVEYAEPEPRRRLIR